jgi:hypothetical protein
MHGFTKALAYESAAKGITVNTIAPGYIATEMVAAMPKEVLDTKIIPLIPVGRLGKPEDIARAVVFLAADTAGFVTGACFDINGGHYMATDAGMLTVHTGVAAVHCGLYGKLRRNRPTAMPACLSRAAWMMRGTVRAEA